MIMEEVIPLLKQITVLLTEIRESQSTSQLEQKSVWTLSEFAAYSGYTVESVYQLTSQGKIPHHKPNGKFVFFDRDEVIAWLLRNPVKEEEAIVMDLLSSKSNRA